MPLFAKLFGCARTTRPRISPAMLDERLLTDLGICRRPLPTLLFSEQIAETNRIRGL